MAIAAIHRNGVWLDGTRRRDEIGDLLLDWSQAKRRPTTAAQVYECRRGGPVRVPSSGAAAPNRFSACLAEHHIHAVRSASRPGEGCR